MMPNCGCGATDLCMICFQEKMEVPTFQMKIELDNLRNHNTVLEQKLNTLAGCIVAMGTAGDKMFKFLTEVKDRLEDLEEQRDEAMIGWHEATVVFRDQVERSNGNGRD